MGESRWPSGECRLMAGWLVGLMVVLWGEIMVVREPVGGASLSGSNSSRMIWVFGVRLMGCGGEGERWWGAVRDLLPTTRRAGGV